MQDTVSSDQPNRASWVTYAILAAELVVIAAAIVVVSTQVADAVTRNISVVLFAVVSVTLRTVSAFSRSKLSRYTVAAVVTLVFVLIRQLF